MKSKRGQLEDSIRHYKEASHNALEKFQRVYNEYLENDRKANDITKSREYREEARDQASLLSMRAEIILSNIDRFNYIIFVLEKDLEKELEGAK